MSSPSASSPSVDPAAALQQAIQQMNGMHAEMQRMAAHNQGLQSQLDSVKALPVVVPSVDRNLPRIPAPSPFTGATGPAVEEFMNSVDRQFDYYANSFASEETKLRYVVNYLGGKAGSWWTALKADLIKAGTPITSWIEFKVALRDRFQPIGSATIARESLDRSQQKGSVASYTEHFYRCMTYIKDMSDADQVHQYSRGLKKEIRQEVIREQPVTIIEAVNIAHKAESFLNVGVPHSFTTSNGRSFTPRYPSGSSSGSAGRSSAMDESVNNLEFDMSALVDRDQSEFHGPRSDVTPHEQQLMAQIAELKSQQQSLFAMFGNQGGNSSSSGGRSNGNGGATHVPGVSKEDYARCRAENRCINCRVVGHVARECTKPKSLKW